MKKIILIFICSFSVFVTFSQTKYYKDTDGKMLDASQFKKMKSELADLYKKTNRDMELVDETHEIRRNRDSIIHEIELSGMLKEMIKQKKEQEKFIGELFPIDNFITITGKKITPKDLSGKPTLINFWFTQCTPCIEEMPVLNKLKAEFGDRVNFISITYDSKEKVLKLFENVNFDFECIADAKSLIDDLKIKSYPQNYFLNTSGYIFSIEGGVEYRSINGEKPKIGDGKKLRALITKLLVNNRTF